MKMHELGTNNMKHHLTCRSIDSSASNISYCDMVWDNLFKGLATRLRKLQNRVGIVVLRAAGFVRVLENLESPGILLWHFPGLESPGKRPLVLESSGNL